MRVNMYSIPDEFDSQLKWPATMKLTLIRQSNLHNMNCSRHAVLSKPVQSPEWIAHFGTTSVAGDCHMMEHSQANNYLQNDTLYFRFSVLVQ